MTARARKALVRKAQERLDYMEGMRPGARYAALLERAAYYRWAAAHEQALPGGDPTTGQPKGSYRNTFRHNALAESRVAYLAMARQALAAAREYRKRYAA